MIQFLLNDTPISYEMERPDLTVLDYLRECRYLRGTKEGCASGDCGACTAVLVEQGEQGLEYRNFNSCITFLGSLHGKQLITVEHLKSHDRLHPVQQAMVDQHGSQCGFCTPGFVMSLFSFYKTAQAGRITSHEENIKEYLSGNLCRCTGYFPIVRAAEQSLSHHEPDQFDQSSKSVSGILAKINDQPGSEPAQFHVPTSARELAKLKNDYPKARLLAGGTDLALEVTQQHRDLDEIIYLGRVQELCALDRAETRIQIGSAVTLDRLDIELGDDFPELRTLLKRFGSRQIRNVGTVGGNIANASPIADITPVLIAMNATCVLESIKGQREILLEDYFLGYKKTELKGNEFIRCVNVPVPDKNTHLKICKVSKRVDDDISAVCLVALISVVDGVATHIRMAFGGMAAIPKRATRCEMALLDQPLETRVVEQAKAALDQDFQPISDVRASAGYRIDVAKNLLDRIFLELSENPPVTRIDQL
ncbi:MAG: xanthine dehydrogenase small subunit [Gammaproteobacteria bacterium]|nr:xanthine dehydrogenase small subunit [Gammaproteobacteria bacterium]MCY4228415.1 xanthine dehydrogenase small subunit [Gammaproteobacteria bacterium]